jgi:hypothetical protein
MEKRQSRILLIITGLLTAVVILFSQLFYVQNTGLTKKEVKTEQTEDQDSQDQETPEDLVITSTPSISIPIASTIEVEKEQSFIFEILFEHEITFPNKVEISRSLGKFFQHMFRVIISPNAP